jgi:hypothetical protein
VDELFADARDQRTKHHPDVGYIFGKTSLFDIIYLNSLFMQAEGPDAFSQFHLYVCSAFLVRWSEKLRQMDFQVCINTLGLFSAGALHLF